MIVTKKIPGGNHEQSADDLLAQGAAAMLTARIVFGGSHPECGAHPLTPADYPGDWLGERREFPLEKACLVLALESNLKSNTTISLGSRLKRNRLDFLHVQPDPHLDEIFAEQDFGWFFDAHDRCW